MKSSHGGTFSEGVPHFEFKENLEDFSKCPNCDEITFLKGKCDNCGYGKGINSIIKIAQEKIEQKINLSNFCTCGNKKGKNSIMCRECYNKYKTNQEFF